MQAVEEVIEELGSFGPYQVRIFLLVSAFETPAAWAMLLPVFAAAKPSWLCPYGVHDNETIDVTIDEDNVILANASHLMENACGPKGNICPGAIYTSDFTSVVSEWDLVCDRDYISSLITTLQMVGVLLGACLTGQLADSYGRKKIFYVVYGMLLLFGFVSSFSTSWQMYASLRFLVGTFFGGTMVINFVLPLEFIGRQWRTFCGCIGFWACGIMTQAGMAYFLREWRHLSLACSLGGIFLLSTWWFVPESPRWLLQKGRQEEAVKIFTTIAKYNNLTPPNYTKLKAYIQEESTKRKGSRNYHFWDLCRSMSLTKNTLILMFAWFVSSSVYYGTNFNVGNLVGNRYLNFFLSGLVELPALIFVVLINNRLGRIRTLGLLMTVAGTSCFAIIIVDLFGMLDSWYTLSLALLGKSGIAGGWAAAQVFSAEVFPTVIRNIGIGSSSMAARIGGIVAPQIVFLNSVYKPLPFIVFGSLGLLCAFLTIFLPETLNQPLPDTLPISDLWPCFHADAADQSEEAIAMQVLAQVDPSQEPECVVELSRDANFKCGVPEHSALIA